MSQSVRILGIDPGSRVTGFGVIESDGVRTRYLASGCIRTDGADLAGRLEQIYSGIARVIDQQDPEEIAVERVFMARNADAALKLGHARSAAICASFGRGASLHEYAARAVKQAVVGRGGADKAQVAHMVCALLQLTGNLASDESDALAVALCHAHSRPLQRRLQSAGGAAP